MTLSFACEVDENRVEPIEQREQRYRDLVRLLVRHENLVRHTETEATVLRLVGDILTLDYALYQNAHPGQRIIPLGNVASKAFAIGCIMSYNYDIMRQRNVESNDPDTQDLRRSILGLSRTGIRRFNALEGYVGSDWFREHFVVARTFQDTSTLVIPLE